ncbi:MAG TPA: LuxR C-terminal-related transcriptional regulator [Ramlibacter sp.]|nr:LuxR C-terminal-related transcriptional regulator [Ramlibacter sp.]
MDFLAKGDIPDSDNTLPVGSASLGSGLALLVDELAHGVLLTSVAGRLLHANQAARHELARRRVLGTRNHFLYTLSPEGGKTLQDALQRVADGKRSLIQLPAQEGPALTLAAVPLKSGGAAQPHTAALMFARSAVCDSLMLCFFARSHGLTAAEEQVLGILCQGYSAPQVASQLKVAVSTVRSHVRSVCAKTRVSGVRELVSRIAVLPPVAPPFWHEPMH